MISSLDDKIEINRRNLLFWILLLLTNIFIIWNYVVSPIRYSNEELEGIITYNKLYYYIHLILLIIMFLYGYSVINRFSPFYGDTTLLLGIMIMVLILSIFALNIMSSKPKKEDGTYTTAPKYIYKSRTKQTIISILLLLTILGVVGFDLYKRKKNPLGLLPYKKLNNLYGILMLIAICLVSYLLFNSSRYTISRYNLPKMWK